MGFLSVRDRDYPPLYKANFHPPNSSHIATNDLFSLLIVSGIFLSPSLTTMSLDIMKASSLPLQKERRIRLVGAIDNDQERRVNAESMQQNDLVSIL